MEQKYQVTEKGAIKRIRRALAKDGEALHIPRGSHYNSDYGEMWVENMNPRWVVATHCTIEGLMNELGLLKPWEELGFYND